MCIRDRSSTDILPSYSLKDPSFNVIFIIIMSSLFIFISYPRACIFFPARSAIIRNLLLFSKRMASTGPATGHSLRTRGEKKSPLQIITVRDELSRGSTLFELTLHSLYIIHQRLLCQNLLIMTITESPDCFAATQR